MISESQSIEIIKEAFPGFETYWKEHLDFWKDQKASICNEMSTFTDFVFQEILKKKDIENVKKFAIITEEFINHGNSDLEYAVKFCLLESLTNKCLNDGNEETSIFLVDNLAPKAKAICKELDKFWGTKTPGL